MAVRGADCPELMQAYDEVLDATRDLAEFWCWGLGFRVQGSGFWVQGLGFRVQGSGLRV